MKLGHVTSAAMMIASWLLAGSCAFDEREVSLAIPGLDIGGSSSVGANGAGGGTTESSRLAVATTAIDLGWVTAGSAARARIRVDNVGTAPLPAPAVGFAAGSHSDFALIQNGCAEEVAAGESCELRVQLVPSGDGERTATLEVRSDVGGEARVALNGLGLRGGDLILAPVAGSFEDFGGARIGTAEEETFSISNPTDVPSGPLRFRVNRAEFELLAPVEGDCVPDVTSLVGGQSCTVRLAFTPTERGPLEATLTGATDGAGAVSVTLAGRGLAPPALCIAAPGLPCASAPMVDFAGVVLGSSAAKRAVRELGRRTADLGWLTPRARKRGGLLDPEQRLWRRGPDRRRRLVQRRARVPSATARRRAHGRADRRKPGAERRRRRGSLRRRPHRDHREPRLRPFEPGSDPLRARRHQQRQQSLRGRPRRLHRGRARRAGRWRELHVQRPVHARRQPPQAANLTAQSPGAGLAVMQLTGRGRQPATLSATGNRDLGRAYIGQAPVATNEFTWTVSNTGDLPTGTLSVENDNPTEFSILNDSCAGSAVPGLASCQMLIRFQPSAIGNRTANIVVADPDGSRSFTLVVTGLGVQLAALGESCVNAECAAGVCTRGVCCDRACDRTCQVCSAQGQCIDQSNQEACGNGAACFGVDNCKLPAGRTCSQNGGDDQCGSGQCERRLGGNGPGDRICCLDDCGNSLQCNAQSRCQAHPRRGRALRRAGAGRVRRRAVLQGV